MLPERSHILYIVLTGFAVIGLNGCASQTKTVSLPVAPPQTFSNSGTLEVPSRWWTTFDNDKLNALVDTALQSNFNLKTAWQRLRASQAIVNRESSALFPDLEGFVEGEVNHRQSAFEDTENLSLGLSSVYEVDLWGRIRSAIQAEEYRAEATFSDFQAAALSLSAEIVQTWYELTEAQNQVELIDEQIQTNQKVLTLLANRFVIGQIQSVDILRQKQLVEATREQKTYAESRVQILEHQLAVLVGRNPQEVAFVPEHLPELPPLPETGVPIDLVRRRPDVQSAFYLLQAADRDLASAISNQYPRLSLSASASSAADNAANLFEDWALSFAGNLIAPVFYGGQLSAEVERIEAVKNQRLYNYAQTILISFQEVEDALIREKKQVESIEQLQEQIDLALQADKQLQIQYFNGSTSYLDVLTALDEVQQLRRDLLSAKRMLVEYRIALYRALAGSLEMTLEK